MKEKTKGFLLSVLAVFVLFLVSKGLVDARASDRTTSKSDRPTQARVGDTYGKLPLAFEANQGQADARVKFLSRGMGYTLFMTPSEAVLALHTQKDEQLALSKNSEAKARQSSCISPLALRMRLVDGNPHPKISGLDKLLGESNYFIGNDPREWTTRIPHYARIRYEEVYPGIDLLFYGTQSRLEYDFVITPGADPKAISLAFAGADKLGIDGQGNLVLSAKTVAVSFNKPRVYQYVNGTKREIPCDYVLKGKDKVGFQLAGYDTRKPLIIDPVLSYPVLEYSTYLGGSSDDIGTSIAVDNDGSVYVTGHTYSIDFPTIDPLQDTISYSPDAFVAKLNSAGSELVYSTYLGGSSQDYASGIAVDNSGNAYVTGYTDSSDFPTKDPFQEGCAGGGPFVECRDGFVVKLNTTGSALVYATYLGGNDDDLATSIAVDSLGSAYVTGHTSSTNFPTVSPFQVNYAGGMCGIQPNIFPCNDAFVTKLNVTGSNLAYSTYLGGSGSDIGKSIAVDGLGNAYLTGVTGSTNFPTSPGAFQVMHGGGVPVPGLAQDCFVTKLDATGSSLAYSTYLGGSSSDTGHSIAVDDLGNAYLTGVTYSSNFPTTPGSFQTDHGGGGGDAFVTKFNLTGTALVYSTFLGGNGEDLGYGIAVDISGKAHVTGRTGSEDFPTKYPIQSQPGSPQGAYVQDAFITKLNEYGSRLLYSTYLGGSPGSGSNGDWGSGIAVGTDGSVFVIGTTYASDFPTQNALQPHFGGGSQDAFVAKITEEIIERATIPGILLLLDD